MKIEDLKTACWKQGMVIASGYWHFCMKPCYTRVANYSLNVNFVMKCENSPKVLFFRTVLTSMQTHIRVPTTMQHEAISNQCHPEMYTKLPCHKPGCSLHVQQDQQRSDLSEKNWLFHSFLMSVLKGLMPSSFTVSLMTHFKRHLHASSCHSMTLVFLLQISTSLYFVGSSELWKNL